MQISTKSQLLNFRKKYTNHCLGFDYWNLFVFWCLIFGIFLQLIPLANFVIRTILTYFFVWRLRISC